MESILFIIAAVVYVLSFFLLVRYSRDGAKYHNSKGTSVKASVGEWKIWGVRTAYFQLVAATSGLITMAVIAIIKVVL
jgi:hypothetical protein